MSEYKCPVGELVLRLEGTAKDAEGHTVYEVTLTGLGEGGKRKVVLGTRDGKAAQAEFDRVKATYEGRTPDA